MWWCHTFLFHIPPCVQITPPRVQITFYLPPPLPDHFLCTSPTYQVALVPFHQKRCYRPYLCFFHTSPLVFKTFCLPPSTTETTFTLPQFGQSRLLQYLSFFLHYFYYTFSITPHLYFLELLVYPHPWLKLVLLYLSLVKVSFCSTTVCSCVTFIIPPSWANVVFCTPHISKSYW